MFNVNEIREKTINVFNRYPIKKVSIFGSYARGEQTENSDIDMLIKDSDIGILDMSNLRQVLTDILGTTVDIICEKDISDVFKFLIRDDEVLIYEKS